MVQYFSNNNKTNRTNHNKENKTSNTKRKGNTNIHKTTFVFTHLIKWPDSQNNPQWSRHLS